MEILSKNLVTTLINDAKDLSGGGRPPFSKLLLFKALIIQSLYNLSDDQLEFQIVDRVSFKRFLRLKRSDKVSDSKTFWLFREQLIEKDVIMGLFKLFNETLDAAGVFANEGKMADASFVEVPRQRNTREENKHIKETGTAPHEWKVKPHKLAQKDVDARWTKKNDTTFYGYKNHIKADTKTKPIEEYTVTDASVHDSQAIEQLLTEKDEGQPLNRRTDSQQQREIQYTCKGRTCVRLCRKQHAWLHWMNLTYNICRCTQLKIAVAMG